MASNELVCLRGQKNALSNMPKFCTLRLGTPVVAAHLSIDPQSALIPLGSFLRESSFDGLPQLWSISAVGMRFVDPSSAV